MFGITCLYRHTNKLHFPVRSKTRQCKAGVFLSYFLLNTHQTLKSLVLANTAKTKVFFSGRINHSFVTMGPLLFTEEHKNTI